MTLPAAITNANAPDNRMRIGIVSSINPLKVNVQGTDFPVGRAASFTPALGETVAIMRQDGTWMIMDRTMSPSDDTLKLQAGSVIVSVAAANNATAAVLFDHPFLAMPSVCTNINNGAGGTFGWGSRAISVSTTGFTAFVFNPTGAVGTFSVDVQWQAQEMTQ